MINMIWVVLFVALTGSHLGYGLPVRPPPQTYPHGESFCRKKCMFFTKSKGKINANFIVRLETLIPIL